MDRTALKDKALLAAGRLRNLQRPDNEETLAKTLPDGGKSIGVYSRDFGMEPWDWPQGVGLYGMQKFAAATGDETVAEYVKTWYMEHLRQPLPVHNINTTAPMLALAGLGQMGEDEMHAWAQWLLHGLPRTADGGFQHTTTDDAEKGTINLNEGEVWVDTLFMAALFLARYGKRYGNAACVDEAVHQFLLHIKYLYDKNTGLFYHGYTFLEKHNFGGIYWGRGNCWFTMAVMELLEILGDTLDGGVKAYLLDTYRAQAHALKVLQSPDGLWHTVLNDPASYTEASGSAGFLYGLLKGVHGGYLDKSYLSCTDQAIQALERCITPDGTVTKVSAGTGMGWNADHYKNIITAPMAYGQALTLLAFSEALRD
ncbi:MAG TPA: glycoside hydrolase family 88 protein [Candidatus Limiplasma sp.]|nr:glycoside hydrolase family 88 protein [Candidatus Limiplasma sp.]